MLRAIMTRTLWSGPRFPQRALAEKIMYEDLTARPEPNPRPALCGAHSYIYI